MAHFHEPTWRKAGIFEAVIASTYKILKNTDLVLGIAEKWCPDTKTFVFPWGETAITLEDVMVLSGFSVLGSPVFATLDSSGEKIMAKLDKEWKKVMKDKVSFVTQVAWMERFMNSGDELEHVAFLVLWLNYFVFPSRLYHLYKAGLPIAVHLSTGTRIALAPAVLAHLYADLSLMKTHITAFGKSTSTARIDLIALFKVVQVWTWERFKELQPKPNPMQKGEPRLALWHDLKQNTSNARQIFDNSKTDSFELRPYTQTVENWECPQFYPEKATWFPVGPNLDDDSLIQKKLALEELALNADNNGPCPRRNFASGDETSKACKSKVLSPSGKSNIHIAVGEGSQGQDCLLHGNALGSEETMKSNEDFEKRNHDFDFDADNDSAKKRIQELKLLALSIEERIIKAQKNVALIKERRAEGLRKIAAASLI